MRKPINKLTNGYKSTGTGITGLFLLCLLSFAFFSCNRAELLSIKDQMIGNVETAHRIEIMQAQLLVDFKNMQVLYDAMEKKLYVTDITTKTDGSYVLTYSDGSTIGLQNGRTPLVTFGAGGEVIINGEGTGHKPVNGEDGYLPVVTINDQGFYVVDGVPTDVKGITGDAGNVPVVSIDDENYYCVNGVRVVPEINLAPTDGTDGHAPVPTIEYNAAANKFELKVNGHSTVPPTFVSPENGAGGADGGTSSYIIGVILTNDDELVFTFNDGSTQKSSPVVLSDLVFKLGKEYIGDILLDGSSTFSYTLRTKQATNPASVYLYVGSKDWQVDITAPDPLTHTGQITVTPIAGGLTSSAILFVAAVDAQGIMIVRRFEVSPAAYQIGIPALANSYVYNVCTASGLKIAEVCKEYNLGAKRNLTVVYPYDSITCTYGSGFVADNGGAVNYTGRSYLAGTSAFQTSATLSSGVIGLAAGGLQNTTAGADELRDIDGNRYKIVKIGTQYWMAENLKAERYRDGMRIGIYNDVLMGNEGAFAYYDNNRTYRGVYGALYNGYAVNTGKLAPLGWHVSREFEWLELNDFLSASVAVLLKSAGTGMNSMTGEWMPSLVAGTNLSGFNGLPGGGLLAGNSDFSLIGRQGEWWTEEKSYVLNYDAVNLLERNNAGFSSYFSVRCIRDNKK